MCSIRHDGSTVWFSTVYLLLRHCAAVLNHFAMAPYQLQGDTAAVAMSSCGVALQGLAC